MATSIKDYKDFIVAILRDFESSKVAGDSEKLRKLGETSDDVLLQKWLWIGAILGAIVSFGILWPVCTFILAPFISSFIMAPLWFVMKFAMGLTLICFGLAVYVTFKRS